VARREDIARHWIATHPYEASGSDQEGQRSSAPEGSSIST